MTAASYDPIVLLKIPNADFFLYLLAKAFFHTCLKHTPTTHTLERLQKKELRSIV